MQRQVGRQCQLVAIHLSRDYIIYGLRIKTGGYWIKARQINLLEKN